MPKKRPVSLKWVLISAIILCWLIPVTAIAVIAGTVLHQSYADSFQKEMDSGARNALRQTEMRLSAVFEESKAVSYDGIVRDSYRAYRQDGDAAALYRTVTEYLNRNFSRNDRIKAVFINYRQDPDIQPYILGQGTFNYGALRNYRETVEPVLLEQMKDADTGIRILMYDNELYVGRNLMDAHFVPYAAVIMHCDAGAVFQSFGDLSHISDLVITLDGNAFRLEPDGGIRMTAEEPEANEDTVRRGMKLEGHEISFTATAAHYNIWEELPGLKLSFMVAALLAVLLLAVVILLIYRLVTNPIEQLIDATSRIEAGRRGYQIEAQPSSAEFQKLFYRFNSMSAELKSQFERLYLEQLALQQAKIKALQSQINPHFLNNTLEIINWEARLADSDRVCAMIEALSTVLDATLARDGRSMIPLREELGYVDAYLYIIQQRLGDRFAVERDIDESLLYRIIPRLILQPIVENAVEHDITARRGGRLTVRACEDAGDIVLEVIHDGNMSDADRENIRELLRADAEDVGAGSLSGQLGLRNVYQRLRLLYGENGRLSVEEAPAGLITARISFPPEQARNG